MEVSKIRKKEEIIKTFKDGQTIAFGGQATMGAPYELIECVLESGAKHLTTISIDAGDPDYALGRLVHAGAIDKMYVTHTGVNPEVMKLIDEGKIEAEYNPMGTLIERMRCGGYGLGGVLTKVGLGTLVQKNKQTVFVGGEEYIIEPAIRADISLVHAHKIDLYGNMMYFGTDTNDNPIVATCGDITIAEAEEILEVGELPIENIHLPGAYVDYIYADPVICPIHKDMSTRFRGR